MPIREEANIGKYTGRGTTGGRCGEFIYMRNCRLSKFNQFQITKIKNLTTADYLLTAHVYVGFRSQQPDNATLQEVRTKLQVNNMNSTLVLPWPANNCQ
jgi:hypothetical protein